MEVINNRENEVEFIINRWIIDFYYSQGIEFFQNDKNEEFLSIKRVFESKYVSDDRCWLFKLSFIVCAQF